jgi:hypothetical protein
MMMINTKISPPPPRRTAPYLYNQFRRATLISWVVGAAGKRNRGRGGDEWRRFESTDDPRSEAGFEEVSSMIFWS